MNLRVVFLVISLLKSFLKNSVINPFEYLKEYYDATTVQNYRKLINTSKKLEKSKLDHEFLLKCKTYNIIPKFLQFKLYRKSLHSCQFYKSWQIKLLSYEIKDKKDRIEQLSLARDDEERYFFAGIDGVFDRILFIQSIKSNILNYSSNYQNYSF